MSKISQSLTSLRDLPNEELHQALATARDDLFRQHLGKYTNQVTSSAALTSKRREIARILTILRSRELGTETQAAAKAAEAPAAAAEAPAKKSRTKKAKS